MKLLHQLLTMAAVVWTLVLFADFQLYYIWYILISFVCIAQLSSFYHRCLSHKMWHCAEWLQYVLLFINAGFLAGHAAIWVAIHQSHHQHADTDKDPHGPKVGLFTTLNNSYYQFNSKRLMVILKNSKPMQIQFKYYYLAPVITFSGLYLIDPVIWPIITAFMWFAIVATNYICHLGNTPRNIPSLFLITGGDSYHKHHHESGDLRFGKFDTGYFVSKLLTKLSSPHT